MTVFWNFETHGTFSKCQNELDHFDLLRCFNPWQKCCYPLQGPWNLLKELPHQSSNFLLPPVIHPYPNAHSTDFAPIIASKCRCLSTAVVTGYHPRQLLLGVRKCRGYGLMMSKPGSIAPQSPFVLWTSSQPLAPSKSSTPLLPISPSRPHSDSFLPSWSTFEILFPVKLPS